MSIVEAVEETVVHDLFRQRRSGRAYDASKPVSDADLQGLLEAARWAPSSNNAQPWRFLAGIKGDGVYEKLFELLMPFNKIWAQQAPMLLLTAFQDFRVNQAGERMPYPDFLHDLGMANLSIAIEATHRGLMTHMVGGFNHEAAGQLIQAETQGLTLGPMMTIGYEGDVNQLGEELQKREKSPRMRKPMEELLLHI